MMITIFIASSIHGSTIDNLGFGKESYHVDAHFVLYFLLGMSYYYLTGSKLKAVFFAFMYGVSDETHQLFVPRRAFQILDIFVDTLGGALGATILWILLAILRKKQKN
jgi:VanZ family protein